VHHDESLHGTYARYAVENPDQSFYHYNPMLHGPLLYSCVAWLFSTFGVSTIVLRSLNAGLGSLFLLSPLLFRRFISPSAVLWSTAALAFSPSLIYWSRFAHHDYLVLASYLLLASGILLAEARVGIILCLISFALQYTIKANIFVFFALLVGFLVFHLLCTMLIKRQNGEKVKVQNTLALKVWSVVCSNKIASVIGACLSAIIFSALYSGNFRDSSGILDGLYRKVFTYWIEQHHIQRLDGPFSFHLLVLFLYELPLLLAFLAALLLAALKLPKLQRGALLVLTLVFLFAPMLLPAELFNKGFLDTYLKVKSPFDLFVSLEIALLAVILSIDFYRKNYLALSFFSYLSLATLWTYSFLGEKVPWLTIYPQISALAFMVLFFDKYGWFERGLLSLGNSISVAKFFAGLSAIILTATTICILEGLVMRDPAALSEHILR